MVRFPGSRNPFRIVLIPLCVLYTVRCARESKLDSVASMFCDRNAARYESNASREMGSRRSLKSQLQMVDLESEPVGLCEPPPDELQEQPGDGDNDDEADDAEKSATMPDVDVKTIHRALSEDTVVEVLWQVSPEGERDEHPALFATGD